MPFLDWDRPHRYKTLDRELEIQRDDTRLPRWATMRELKFRQGPSAYLNAFDSKLAHRLMSNSPETKMLNLGSVESRLKRMKRDPQGRLLAGTALGQVLLDAAALSIAISTHRDCALLQLYDMSYRQPFVKEDLYTYGFSRDDIVYRASAHARMLMLGDLWLWVLDENTILTCLAPRAGEDASSDSRDLQREIHQVLSHQLLHGLAFTVDNILTVILEVCLDVMFKGFTQDPDDIDLTWVAESEIASLVRY